MLEANSDTALGDVTCCHTGHKQHARRSSSSGAVCEKITHMFQGYRQAAAQTGPHSLDSKSQPLCFHSGTDIGQGHSIHVQAYATSSQEPAMYEQQALRCTVECTCKHGMGNERHVVCVHALGDNALREDVTSNQVPADRPNSRRHTTSQFLY